MSWLGDADHLGAESVAVVVHVEEAQPAPPPGSPPPPGLLKLLEGIPIAVLNAVATVLMIMLLLALVATFIVVREAAF